MNRYAGSRRGGVLVFVLVLAVLAAIAGGIAVGSRRDRQRRGVAQARVRAELWGEADAYRQSCPADIDGAIGRYEAVAERLAGTAFEERAQRVIEELRRERTQAVESAWRDLESGVVRLTEQRDFIAAAALLDGYDGVYGAELAERIAAAAKRLSQQAAQDEKRQSALREAAGERQRETLARVAGALYDGEVARAASVLRETLDDQSLPVDRAALVTVLELLAQVQRADEIILASFAAESDEIELTIAGQSHRVLFAGVGDGRLQLRQRRAAGWVTADVALDMLEIGERRRRLTAAAGPEAAGLWAAIQYRRAENFEQLSAALAGGGALTPFLLERAAADRSRAGETEMRLTEKAKQAPVAAADAGVTNRPALVLSDLRKPRAERTAARALFHDDFERTNREVGAVLERNSRLKIVKDMGVGGGRALQASYIGYPEGSERIGARVPLERGETEATLCFDVCFAEGFQFVRGGKLLGLAPDKPITGGNPMHPQGWSARIMWGREGRIQTYLYCQNKEGKYGASVVSPGFRFVPGRYHAISLHVKMNEPPEQANGFAHLYVDGKLEARHDDVQFRGSAGRETLISQFMFSSFHGGHTPEWAPRTPEGGFSVETAWFDNIAVYRGAHVRETPTDQ